MALRAFLVTVVVVVAAVSPALAIDYIVGDDAGWDLDFDYTKWTEGKDFRVGDTIAFKYKPGVHNVLKVNGPDFQRCTSTNATSVPLTSGKDVITILSPGKKWYICDIGDHCSMGMKLVISVSAVAEGPTPDPTPGTSAAARKISPLESCVWWFVAAMSAYMMMNMIMAY
ncbi:hypothetical protein ABFX02_05G090200 [Erythranthe guttata]